MKRRVNVVGIFPNEQSIVRLIGAILLEQNDEWQLQSRYMQVEAMAEFNPPTARGAACPNSTHGSLTDGHLNRSRIYTTLTDATYKGNGGRQIAAIPSSNTAKAFQASGELNEDILAFELFPLFGNECVV